MKKPFQSKVKEFLPIFNASGCNLCQFAIYPYIALDYLGSTMKKTTSTYIYFLKQSINLMNNFLCLILQRLKKILDQDFNGQMNDMHNLYVTKVKTPTK